MSKAYPIECGGAIRFEGGRAGALPAADWLRLAAAPVFAMMALLTGAFGGDQSNPLCAVAQDAMPLSGMVLMYLLMSVFHLAPWLKLLSRERSSVRSRTEITAPTRP